MRWRALKMACPDTDQCRNGLDLLSECLLDALEVITLLQIEPEIRTVSAQLAKLRLGSLLAMTRSSVIGFQIDVEGIALHPGEGDPPISAGSVKHGLTLPKSRLSPTDERL